MNLTLTDEATMSSREIAKLLGKQHSHILRDIENFLNKLGIPESKFGSSYKDANGKNQKEYRLNKKYSEMFVASKHPLYLEKIYDRWQELEAKESKPMTQMEIVVASAQALLEVERKQLALEQEQESIKDRLKAVEGKTDTVSKPKPAGYGSKDDLVLELKREFDVSGAVIEFVIKRYCGQYSDTYEYSYQKNEATFKDEAKCWQTDMVRAELETFLSETYPHKRKNCFTHDDYDGYFQWPSNKSNWKKSN